MSTLEEIETAADALPLEERRELLRHLTERMRAEATSFDRLRDQIAAEQAETERMLSRPAMTPEEVAEGDRVLAEMRKKFRLRKFEDPDGPAAPLEDWDALRDIE